MSPIRLTVDHMPGETATSLLSRLAARNGIPTAGGFCRDHRLRLQDVVDGEPAAIHGLAEMAGVDPNRLFASAFRRSDTGTIRFGTEILMSNWMSRRFLRVCPTCLLEDAAASPLKRDAAMYGRAWWQVAFVRTCHVHAQSLAAFRPVQSLVHDFAAGVRLHAPDMSRLAAETERREATDLERYLVRRLSGETGGVPFLDRLQLGLAARFCEVLGRVRLHGRTRRSGKLHGEGLRVAGHEGFALAAGGDEAVRSFIESLLDAGDEGRSANGGAQSALGPLHDWLSDNRRSKGQDELRDLVREVVAANLPLSVGSSFLGGVTSSRRLHSIRSASLETGVHPKRLRKVLYEAGFIEAGHERRRDNMVTFSADASANFLAKLVDTMSMAEVADYINAPRVQTKLLVDAGFLVPVYPRQETGKRILAFARADVDRFMASMLDRAEILDGETHGAHSIMRAAKRVPCGAMDIVRLIRERRLPWVGRRSDDAGYISIRVRHDQVRPVIFPEIGISVREAATRLELPIGITRRLLKAGFLEAVDGGEINYAHETYIVDPRSIDNFKRDFIALSELVPGWGPTRLEARSALIKYGIKPATSSYEVGKAYFLRTDIEHSVSNH